MTGWKRIVNIALPIVIFGDMIFYGYCITGCSSLKGDFLGIDMKYVGLIIPVPLIVLALLKQDLLYLASVSFGVGGEIKLVAFQVDHGFYCPYCLIAGGILLLLFVLNFRWSRKYLMGSCVLGGFLAFQLFFHGSVTPVYAQAGFFSPKAIGHERPVGAAGDRHFSV